MVLLQTNFRYPHMLGARRTERTQRPLRATARLGRLGRPALPSDRIMCGMIVFGLVSPTPLENGSSAFWSKKCQHFSIKERDPECHSFSLCEKDPKLETAIVIVS